MAELLDACHTTPTISQKDDKHENESKSKLKWRLSSRRTSLNTSNLLKDIKRSMSEFVGPIFQTEQPDGRALLDSNEIHSNELDSLIVDNGTHGNQAHRNQLDGNGDTPETSSALKQIDGCNPLNSRKEFQSAVLLASSEAGVTDNSGNSKEKERECRKEATRDELILEDLRVDVAVRLAVAQSISSGQLPNFNSDLLLGTSSLNSIKEETEIDPRKRCDLILSSPSDTINLAGTPADTKTDTPTLPLGALAAHVASSQSGFPSKATTEMDFIVALLKLPVLCFVGCLSFRDRQSLPQIKQDSKDLTRDVVRLNGTRVSGAAGYKNVYQRLAKDLLTPALQQSYMASELNHDQTVRLLRRSEEEELAFNIAETQALTLLHLVNRTLAGGHCFEKVLAVFGNDALSIVVPNSKGAQPLDIILPKDGEGEQFAVLRSHTSFRVFPAGATPDLKNCYADVDAHFMANINVVSVCDAATMRYICFNVRKDLEVDASTHNAPEILSPRLHQWIERQAKEYESSSGVDNRINGVDYRIYLSCSTSA